MNAALIYTVLEISLSTAAVILAALALTTLTSRRYSARGRYILWLILAARLLVPFNIRLPEAPVTIEPSDGVVVWRTDAAAPVAVMSETERAEAAIYETSSLNYAPIFTVAQLLTRIWLMGALIFALIHFISYVVFKIKIKNRIIPDGEYNGLKIYRCDIIDTPMLAGFIRPKIFLPRGELTENEREIILAHEYTHFLRHDLWYKLLLVLANAAHWFNPAVYLMVRRAARDLEYSCDEAVVRGRDINFRRQYSLAILKAMRRKNEYLTGEGREKL